MEQLVKEIEQDIEYASYLTGISKLSQQVIRAIKETSRQDFVLKENAKMAYENLALSIGHGQTISQPLIVALMTELLEPKKTDIVLEIGTGSGYQAAVLSRLVKKVYSLEVIPELFSLAKKNLLKQKIQNVEVILKDGSDGLLVKAPFDKIIFTASAKKVPQKLLAQLKLKGIMVGPIEKDQNDQMLVKIIKDAQEKIVIKDILPVKFVPFINS